MPCPDLSPSVYWCPLPPPVVFPALACPSSFSATLFFLPPLVVFPVLSCCPPAVFHSASLMIYPAPASPLTSLPYSTLFLLSYPAPSPLNTVLLCSPLPEGLSCPASLPNVYTPSEQTQIQILILPGPFPPPLFLPLPFHTCLTTIHLSHDYTHLSCNDTCTQ